ncbi:hypothetical protein PRIPAC_72214 [Pristionchus pacificus]|nr:hypothetical protein PRIPAC_72214 [Pristionchus pacificus]
MEDKKQRRCPNLLVTLCIVSFILCAIFAGTSIFLWIRLASVSYEPAPPSNEDSQQQAAQKYPFFPNSIKDEDRMRKMVSDINAANLSWKAKFNAFASLKGSNHTSLGWDNTNSLMLPGQTFEESLDLKAFGDTKEHLTKLASATITLPESFDARDKWPRCGSIHRIPNQGGCGSCGSRCVRDVGSAVYFFKGERTIDDLSARSGVMLRILRKNDFTPQCNRTCKSFYWIKTSEWYSHMNLSYHEVMTLTSDLSISSNDLIKREIITNGPVSFCTFVAEPFVHYSSGIYDSSQFEVEGHENLSYGHCMRMIGWGKENGQEFWTIANSWGREWGENGFGKISLNYRPDDLSVYAGTY